MWVGMQALLNVKPVTDIQVKSLEDFTAEMLGMIGSMFFVALFTIIGGTVMMALAGLILVRYIVLSILLIIMPLVWVFSIFPVFADWWKKWWSKFLEWLFFLPAALFFLYLTILMVKNFGNDPNSITQVIASVDASSASSFERFFLAIANTLQIFGQMIVVLGILVGGMIAAKSASGFGASGIIGASERVRGWAIGKVKGTAVTPGRLAGRGAAGAGRWAGQKYLRPGAKKIASGLSRAWYVPGARGAGSALSNYLAKGKEAVSDYQKSRLDNLTKEGLMASSELGPQAQAAKAGQLAKDGHLNEYLNTIADPDKRKKKMDMFVKAVKNMGTEKGFLKSVPHLAPEFGKKIDEVVSGIAPKDIINVSEEAFIKIEVISALKKNQLKELGKSISPEIKQTIEDTLGKERTDLSLITTKTPEQSELSKKLDEINKFITSNPAWQ